MGSLRAAIVVVSLLLAVPGVTAAAGARHEPRFHGALEKMVGSVQTAVAAAVSDARDDDDDDDDEGSSGGPQPTATPKPVKTPKPEKTPTPEKTPKPENTPKPEKTPKPEDTPTPAGTPDPTTTPSPAPTSAPTTPEPAVGETVVVRRDRGTVRVKVPGAARYKTVDDATTIPVNALVDASAGRIALTSQLTDGTTQVGRFSGGTFRVRQSERAGGLTRISLAGRLDCGAKASAAKTTATVARKRRKRRQIWGNDSGGNFQTNGRDSVATVRGTRWLTRDTCRGTLVRVVKGAVSVRAKGSQRTVLVKAGHSRFTPRR